MYFEIYLIVVALGGGLGNESDGSIYVFVQSLLDRFASV